MKECLLDFIICPGCLPVEHSLTCRIFERNKDDVLAGTLLCEKCRAEYPIEDGIAELIPPAAGNPSPPDRYEDPTLVSSYLWSHYADIFGDEDAGSAYRKWSELISPVSGISLDTGCASGRFTFELSRKSDFAVGFDNSRAFISKARELMKRGVLEFSLVEEGLLHKRMAIELPEDLNPDKVEFVLGDAQAVPFKTDLFSIVSSLNVVDKVPFPLIHLQEISRVAAQEGSHLLFSDPFSWSLDTAREEDWLGGTPEGPFKGGGMENIPSILAGDTYLAPPPWSIEKMGWIWWKVRHHRNRFELIRSCYVKACR